MKFSVWYLVLLLACWTSTGRPEWYWRSMCSKCWIWKQRANSSWWGTSRRKPFRGWCRWFRTWWIRYKWLIFDLKYCFHKVLWKTQIVFTCRLILFSQILQRLEIPDGLKCNPIYNPKYERKQYSTQIDNFQSAKYSFHLWFLIFDKLTN